MERKMATVVVGYTIIGVIWGGYISSRVHQKPIAHVLTGLCVPMPSWTKVYTSVPEGTQHFYFKL